MCCFHSVILIKLNVEWIYFELQQRIDMEVNIEELVAGLFFLAYVVYGPLVKGGFWKQNWTNKGGRWVTAAEGPIFFVCMLILFLALGIVLTLEGLNII